MHEAAFADLEQVYADLDAEIARMGPTCWNRTLCCRFAQAGHRLFTTPLEYEYLKMRTGLADARRDLIEQGTCPFLRDGRCGVRLHRMMGCRVYFCDPSFQERMPAVYEKFHRRVAEVMRRHAIPYGYFEFIGRVRRDVATCDSRA